MSRQPMSPFWPLENNKVCFMYWKSKLLLKDNWGGEEGRGLREEMFFCSCAKASLWFKSLWWYRASRDYQWTGLFCTLLQGHLLRAEHIHSYQLSQIYRAIKWLVQTITTLWLGFNTYCVPVYISLTTHVQYSASWYFKAL